MPTETTPLRNGEPRRPPLPDTDRQRRIAGLAVFGLVMMTIAILTTTSIGVRSDPQPIPEPVKATHEHSPHQSVLNTTTPQTPAPTSETWFRCGTENSESGYITLASNEENHYFYWFFQSRNAPATDPLVLWLTGGGSGCSSLTVLLSENGPCQLNADLTTALNMYSWTTEANMIWLDQPINVGFSYGDDTSADANEVNAEESIYWFLHGFLDKHPEFEGRPLFLAGEGYASHYIPAAAHYIWRENRAAEEVNATIRLNLEGISIGNGLINPVIQMSHTLDMAVQNAYNISLLNTTQLAAAEEALQVCENQLGKCQTNTNTCLDSDSLCSSSLLAESHRNKFDVRKRCAARDPSDCYNTTAVADYLNSKTVRSYLKVSDQVPSWQKCASSAVQQLVPDLMKNVDGYIADLLNDGSVRVLIYNGDADLVCNWYGSQAWTRQLDWVHQQEFRDAKERKFLVPGDLEMVEAGSVRAYKTQFSFVRIFSAGHMVPKDQPFAALEMINRFMRNETL
ncbi:hypothetical protein PHYBOEH_010103 [Phytophthora boehmeriae]|uniref:Serine protease family S10 n=1 Tax=Phytophthora boehmeriae TaxID=109152 RepID=A0A8T1VPJ3_9STRA|nr:hypothetical protein PHYBOEH_010103 [Phytophthora boehmeriae]